MSWTKLDDLWSEKIEDTIGEDMDARWHYLALIQLCSRLNARDGILSRSKAERCSDLPDPQAAISKLTKVGLVVDHGNKVRVVRAAEHVISEAKVKETERKRADQRRSRAHRYGDHAFCEPGRGDRPKDCQWATTPNGDVTGDGDAGSPTDFGESTKVDHSTPRDSRGDVTSAVGEGRAATGEEPSVLEQEGDRQTRGSVSTPVLPPMPTAHEASAPGPANCWLDGPPGDPEPTRFGAGGDQRADMFRRLREKNAG